MLLDVDILWRQNAQTARAKFTLEPGITALIGPSGAGKTTLARHIAGLERPAGGSIRTPERVLYHGQKDVFLAPSTRAIGLVAQDAALFPHLTVAENIAFSPHSTPESRLAAIEMMNCSHLLERSPVGLSGGERRRVAIARAVAAQHDLLVLDEPMTGLDPKARQSVLPFIKRLSRMEGVGVLFITHQLEEMLSVADHALLMAPGQVIAAGSLEDIIRTPDCAELLGLHDAGQLLCGSVVQKTGGMIEVDIGGTTMHLPDGGEALGADVTMRLFSADIAISRQPVTDISVMNQIPANISAINLIDGQANVHLALEAVNLELVSQVTRNTVDRMALAVGDRVLALIKAVSVKDVVLPETTTP